MPANREAYENAMNEGHNAAWDQDWTVAVTAYGRAVQEFPEDPEAHIHLGLALLQANRLEDALRVYKRAHQLAPDDPIPLEKSADVLERMGRLKEAAQQYVNVSDVYLALRDMPKAIGNWERATQLTPGLVQIHAKLAQAYERIGEKNKAIREYLTLAFNFQRMNENDKAMKAVERALRLDKRNVQALNTLRALKSGAKVQLPADMEEEELKGKRGTGKLGTGKLGTGKLTPPADFDIFNNDLLETPAAAPTSDPRGPLGEVMGEALTMLAAHVVESGSLDAAGGDAMQGMALQRQELYEQAITAYQRADTKLRNPALKLNLGALLLLTDQPEQAIKTLSEVVNVAPLAAGALHGLGQANAKLGKHKAAATYLIRCLQTVDTALALNVNEAAELSQVYNTLLAAVEARSEEALAALTERFGGLLTGGDWKQRIPETRRHLGEILSSGEGEQGMIDFLVASRTGELQDSLGKIDRYIAQGLLTLAMDEAHYVIEYSPQYLPVHVRMADIMMKEGRVRQAITKYEVVARSYLVRGETEKTTSILKDVLEMAPLDIGVRTSLIDLLRSENRQADALDHYIALADTYQQLGNFEMARETYGAAERLARQINAPLSKVVEIKHRVADIDQLRLDLRKAQRTYEEIVQVAPDDERAYRMLVDLGYNQNNTVEAIKHLDKLLGLYAKNKQVTRITQLLEELVNRHRNDTGLRARLASIYGRLGRKEDAVEQYNALFDLQIETGLQNDAKDTLRSIIALKPPQVNDYVDLLRKLGG